ncbi:MAG: hypothetical protein LUF27_08365 [Lachnospiraceae bacterium]|nr:hypothetical protein [Lachnospiraceae bacterium]
MADRCIYFVEGPCEQQLIRVLKENPGLLIPGKIKVFNVVQKLLPKSQLLSIQPGTMVVFAFDTDVPVVGNLKKNIELLKRYCSRVEIIYLAQVLNLEDELVRCTDIKNVQELTKSSGVHQFKSDFCKMKTNECRHMLERHHFEINRMWMSEVPQAFCFIERNGKCVRI